LDILFISGILAECGQWHVLCNFPVDPNEEF
jgi:hypothetical protein